MSRRLLLLQEHVRLDTGLLEMARSVPSSRQSAIIDGQDIAIEAKFVSDFSISPCSPDSFAGAFKDPKTGLTAFQRNVEQARTYSNNFESVIYHSNSQGFIDYYRPVFERENLTNVRFIQTPLKKP